MTAPVFEASLSLGAMVFTLYLEAIVAQMLHKKEPHIDSKDDAFPKPPMCAGSVAVTACRPVLHGHLQVFRGHDAGSPGFDQCLATSLLTTRHKAVVCGLRLTSLSPLCNQQRAAEFFLFKKGRVVVDEKQHKSTGL